MPNLLMYVDNFPSVLIEVCFISWDMLSLLFDSPCFKIYVVWTFCFSIYVSSWFNHNFIKVGERCKENEWCGKCEHIICVIMTSLWQWALSFSRPTCYKATNYITWSHKVKCSAVVVRFNKLSDWLFHLLM